MPTFFLVDTRKSLLVGWMNALYTWSSGAFIILYEKCLKYFFAFIDYKMVVEFIAVANFYGSYIFWLVFPG